MCIFPYLSETYFVLFFSILFDTLSLLKSLSWLLFLNPGLVALVLLFLFLLVLGAILDIFSALVLVVPLILPVAAEFGVHPVHLGIVFLATMQLGYLTPPVGLNLFVIQAIAQSPLGEIVRGVLPFIAIMLFSVLLIWIFPDIVMFIPNRL